METRVARPLLWLRALFAGSFAFFLGVAGHIMADGLLPGTAFLVVLFAFIVLTGLPMLARPASRVQLLALLVGGQTFIHLCLTLTAGHAVTRGRPRWLGRATPASPSCRSSTGAGWARSRTPSSAPAPSRRPHPRCPSTTSWRTCRRTRR